MCGIQALGQPSRVVQEGSALAIAPSLGAPYASLEQSQSDNARLKRDRLLTEVPTPAWPRRSAGVSESKQAQQEHSTGGVTLVQRSADLDEPLLDLQEAPMSQAAAVWEDIVEVRAPSLCNRALHAHACAASLLHSMFISYIQEIRFHSPQRMVAQAKAECDWCDMVLILRQGCCGWG